jgi:1-acyl-sn-glycerol-3-phosphate acyltransferase
VIYWLAKHLSLGPLLRLLFRPWVEGQENIPSEGPAIIASNHLSFSDSFFFPVTIHRRVTFLAKSDYFTGRGLRGWLTAGFFRGLGQLPVDRDAGRGGQAALRTGLRVLERGALLGIYPEGTRSPDGRLYRGRTGVARLALTAQVPVIPVSMIDTDKIQPPGQLVPKLLRPGVRIGRPLDFSRYAGLEQDRYVLRAVTDEIMYEIMRLSGQEYVDVYATTMKARLAEAKQAAGKAQQDTAGKGEKTSTASTNSTAGSAVKDAAASRPPAARPAEVALPATGATHSRGRSPRR